MERLAEPVAQLGVNAQVLERPSVGAILPLAVEGVESDFRVERPLAGKAELRPRVESGGTPIRQVCLDTGHGSLLFSVGFLCPER